MNREELEKQYGDSLKSIPIVTNMNTGFRGPRGLNRVTAVNVGRLNRWINDLASKSGILAERPLATYTLPGSHDAMTYAFKPNWTGLTLLRGATVTQNLNLLEQFNLGVRYFDLRVKANGNKLYGFHGVVDLTGDDAARALHDLFNRAVTFREPIVIKFDYKGNAFPIVKRIANTFEGNLLPTEDYWHKGVGNCIREGRVLCLFHKVKEKHRIKYGDEIDTFGDYNQHKMGGFSNKHNMKQHQKYLQKNLDLQPTLEEEKLKVMSLNIPAIPTKGLQITGMVLNYLLLNIPGTVYKAGQVIGGTPRQNRWIGFKKSVESIEASDVTKQINLTFVGKMQDLVDYWYEAASNNVASNASAPHIMGNIEQQITQQVSGAVGMDFVGSSDKRNLILQLIEVNNRDF